MTLQKLASAIAKREGKKHQASIGDVREILRIIIDREANCYVKNMSSRRFPTYLITKAALRKANPKRRGK